MDLELIIKFVIVVFVLAAFWEMLDRKKH